MNTPRILLSGLTAALTLVSALSALPARAANCAGVGAWSATTTYSTGSKVTYAGGLYQAQTSTTNVPPNYCAACGWWQSLGTCDGTNSGGGTTGGGTTGGGTTGGGTTGGGTTGSCNSTTWAQGVTYATGAIVKYSANGNYYQCTHDNPGYDPTISTWFWSPYTCSGGGGGTTCNALTWAAGTTYATGVVVKYPANGNYYQCTHDNPGYDPTISTWFWSPTTCSGTGGGGGNNGGGGGSALKPGACPQDQWNYMVSAAATLGMPADFAILLASVDLHESSFGAGLAGSPSAGDGLMQVQPATRGAYAGSFSATFGHGYNDSAADQIAMGALIYKDMINLCGGQYRCGCMKYNGGPNYVPGSVDAYGRPIYAETYAANVMATYQSWGGTHQ